MKYRCLLAFVASAWLPAQLAMAAVGETSGTVAVPQVVRALPGGLDRIPVVNSNSPEVVQLEGILVSTLSPAGKLTPSAHLDLPLNGRFDVFMHHIARADDPQDLRTLYVAILLTNDGSKAANVEILQAASYLSQPDAPFVTLPDYQPNDAGNVYAGPGDRVMDDILRGLRQADWPSQITVPPGATIVVKALPIPVAGLTPPINGRSLLARFKTDRPVYAATLALFAKTGADGSQCPPSDADWQKLLVEGGLAGPREKPPSEPRSAGAFAYGRVGGVSRGSQWIGRIDGSHRSGRLDVAALSQPVSFPLSSVENGTLGTGQIQSAPMLRREPDTAYAAHGNYAVKYAIDIALFNDCASPRPVALKIQTPLKQESRADRLSFLVTPSNRVFFRGTVRLSYNDDAGTHQDRFIHIVQHQGQAGQPLISLSLKRFEKRNVHLEFLYPPDATPPQALTIEPLTGASDSTAAGQP